ncbi:hypothetical protein Tco_0463013 [Tanacetum coccineum]
MAQLKYCDKHNQVGFLFKPAESAGYTEIVDFPYTQTKLRYALTHNPPIYDSLVKQFWQTATARTLADGIQQLNATILNIQSLKSQPQPSADPTPSQVLYQPPSYRCPSFEPSYHMSPPFSHEPEIQASRSSEESEQLKKLMDIVPRLESRVKSLEKELSETKQTLGTEILQLMEKVKKLETPPKRGVEEKRKTSEGFKGSQAPLGSKIYRRKPKSKPTPTKILHFEEPDESQVNTGSTLSAQVNTAELNAVSTPSAQVNTAEVDTAALNTGETERVQRRKGKDPMTEEDLQAEVQASKKSKELQELADLEEAQRLQAKMDAETQRQIDLDALLARRVQEQEEEAAKEALATEFDYIQARLNADQILAEKIQQEEREQYSIEERAK